MSGSIEHGLSLIHFVLISENCHGIIWKENMEAFPVAFFTVFVLEKPLSYDACYYLSFCLTKLKREYLSKGHLEKEIVKE